MSEITMKTSKIVILQLLRQSLDARMETGCHRRGLKADCQLYGECGILIQGLSDGARAAVEIAVQTAPPAGFLEWVHGYENMLLIFRAPEFVDAGDRWVKSLAEPAEHARAQGRLVQVPVRYDGTDLAEVARLTHLSEAEVVAIHSAPEYRVRMMGFAPGFPYLDGLDPRLHLARRASPRNHIAPGTVAIGGGHAGIYSVASPGGWHLLGQTDLPLFRPELAKLAKPASEAVFALAPGDRVKFIPQK